MFKNLAVTPSLRGAAREREENACATVDQSFCVEAEPIEKISAVAQSRTKCRLLYLVGGLGPGGLERQLYFLLQAMDRDKYRPELVVWSFREGDTYVEQIRKLRVPLHSFPDTFNGTTKLRAFRRLLAQVRPEVVHAYSFYTNFAAWWAVQGTPTIAIGSCRSDFLYEQKGSGLVLGRLSGCLPRHQVCNNSLALKNVRSMHNLFVPKELSVVRNGIDLETFKAVPISLDSRTRILGVGSLLAIKRWDRLIELAADLKHMGFDFLLRIAGNGPLRESLEQESRQRGVADRVKFLGHCDDVSELLADSTFLVHASDSEGLPNAVIEAMACSRAVVATDVGDIPFMVEDGNTGFVVPRGDHQALIDRTIRLISDRSLCQRMGEAGRARARQEFGLDRLCAQTLEAYRSAGWRDPQ
jgi:glycosyltransferase involved in cell wall biosynthesis